MARTRTGPKGGFALKGLQWFLRFVEFLCAAIILGIFSYFLASLSNRGLNIDNHTRAVEGISGVAVLYTLAGLLLLCFVAGKTIFSLIAIIFDLAFAGAFAYVVYQTRNGASSCNGVVNTRFGSNAAEADVESEFNQEANTTTRPNLPNYRQACQLETACFAVAIVAVVFFLLSALVEFSLWRKHKANKAFGPSPANNYTSGHVAPRRRFWQRKPKRTALAAGGVAAHEKHHQDALPTHSTPADVRSSYATDNTAVGTEPAYNKYGTGPTGTGVGHHYQQPHGAAAAGYGNGTTGTGLTGHHQHGTDHHHHAGELPASQYPNHSVHTNY